MQKHVASLLMIIMFICTASVAHATSQEELFLRSVEGQWRGPGEIIAGKYKGTKFTCTFAGISEIAEMGMTLDGTCRMGIFSQPIKAKFTRNADGYHGTFNNGSPAQGLDITSGRINRDHMVFNLNRKQLNGSMLAHLADSNSMNITLSIRIEEAVIPVVDMKLTRTGPVPIRNLARN